MTNARRFDLKAGKSSRSFARKHSRRRAGYRESIQQMLRYWLYSSSVAERQIEGSRSILACKFLLETTETTCKTTSSFSSHTGPCGYFAVRASRSHYLIVSRQAYSRAALLKLGAVAPRWQKLFLLVVMVVFFSTKLILFSFLCKARAGRAIQSIRIRTHWIKQATRKNIKMCLLCDIIDMRILGMYGQCVRQVALIPRHKICYNTRV